MKRTKVLEGPLETTESPVLSVMQSNYLEMLQDKTRLEVFFSTPPPVKSAVVTGKLLSDAVVLGELDNPLMTVVQGCGSM